MIKLVTLLLSTDSIHEAQTVTVKGVKVIQQPKVLSLKGTGVQQKKIKKYNFTMSN